MMAEIKKLLHEKVIFILLIIVSISAVVSSMSYTCIQQFTSKQDERYYQEILHTYEGKMVESDFVQLQKQYNTLKKAENKRLEIYEQLNTASSDNKSLQKELESVTAILQKEEAYHTIKLQAEYVKQDLKHRSMMNPVGWKEILTIENMDIFLVLALLLINIPLFTIEFETDMHPLVISTCKGKTKQFISKCKAGLLLSGILIFLFLMIRDLPFFFRYDVSNSNALIQSIQTFENAPYYITCIEMFLYTRGIQFLGYLGFCMLLWVISIKGKQFFFTFCIGLGSMLILYLFIPAPYIYYLPTPVLLILASGLFRGDEVLLLNRGTENEIPVESYTEIHHALAFFMLVLFLALVFFLLRNAYRNYGNFKHRKRTWRYVSIVLLSVWLSGCDMQTALDTMQDTSLHSNMVKNRDKIYMFDHTHNEILEYDTEKKTIEKAIHSIDYDKKEFHSNLVSVNTHICYLASRGKIDCYDIEHHTIQTLRQPQDTLEKKYLFGLIKKYDYTIEDVQIGGDMIDGFFIDEGNLYMIQEHEVIKQNMTSKKEAETMLSNFGYNAIYMDGSLYYISDVEALNVYDLHAKKQKVLDGHAIDQLEMYDGELYYTYRGQDGIYTFDGKEKRKYAIENDRIYAANHEYLYLQKENGKFYLYDKITGKTASIPYEDIVEIISTDKDLLVVREISGENTYYSYSYTFENGLPVHMKKDSLN